MFNFQLAVIAVIIAIAKKTYEKKNYSKSRKLKTHAWARTMSIMQQVLERNINGSSRPTTKTIQCCCFQFVLFGINCTCLCLLPFQGSHYRVSWMVHIVKVHSPNVFPSNTIMFVLFYCISKKLSPVSSFCSFRSLTSIWVRFKWHVIFCGLHDTFLP